MAGEKSDRRVGPSDGAKIKRIDSFVSRIEHGHTHGDLPRPSFGLGHVMPRIRSGETGP